MNNFLEAVASFQGTLCLAFLSGFFIPTLTRRLLHCLPADPGTALFHVLFQTSFFPQSFFIREKQSKKNLQKWRFLMIGFLRASFFWGAFNAVLIGTLFYLEGETAIYFLPVAILLGMLALTDRERGILPDVLTITLTLYGLLKAFLMNSAAPDILPSPHFLAVFPPLPPYANALFAAILGYLIPTVAVLILSFFRKRPFGGGDVKLLIALGACSGLNSLFITLFLSVLLFMMDPSNWKKEKAPFGPSLIWAFFIAVVFLTYVKAPL